MSLVTKFGALGVLLLSLASGPLLSAADYFVGKTGNDANDGLSAAAPFLTVGKGVAVLQAGDTLTIGPGEYRESVSRKELGSDATETIIRAEIPGTALLRGDVAVAAFEKVDGYRFVYSAPFEGDPQAVLEHDTLRILEAKPTLSELEFSPASFFYDKEQKRLYISTSDLRPAEQHYYTVSILPDSGLLLQNPRRVIVDGLAATGYYRAKEVGFNFGVDQTWGISLFKPVGCTVRNVTAYLNAGGICLDGGRNGVIERCTAYGNYSIYQGNGNIARYRSEGGDLIQNCTSYRSPNYGIIVYPNLAGSLISRENLDWGDFSHFKGKGMAEFLKVENSVGVDGRNPSNLHHSLVFPYNFYSPEPSDKPDSNIVLRRDAAINESAEFAAPYRMDYRLQATSQFRNSGPEGKDRGPFPYEPTIFYVKPEGDDSADGLSVGAAWKTAAVSRLKEGDTLYLEGGIYRGDLKVDGKSKLQIRSRGKAPVVFDGAVSVKESSGITFDGIHFTGEVKVNGGAKNHFRNCTFQGKAVSLIAENSPELLVEQSLFIGFKNAAIKLKAAPGVTLKGNLYANSNGPAVVLEDAESIRYADYNSYANKEKAWKLGSDLKSMSALPTGREVHSVVIVPELRVDGNVPQLVNGAKFVGGGPLGKPFGPYFAVNEPEIRLEGPVVHSVGDTVANLEWHLSVPSAVELAWGDTPECKNRKVIKGSKWGAYSLTNLAPEQTVYYRINRVIPNKDASLVEIPPFQPDSAPKSFKTLAAAPAPSTFYVAVDGDDIRDGLSPEKAWRTLSHAGSTVKAGDTVLIAGGTYGETVRIRATGTEGRPISFRALPGQRVTIDGVNRSLGEAFILAGKNHIQLDAFYFRNFSSQSSAFEFLPQQKGMVVVNQGREVSISRAFSDGRGVGYNPPFLLASDSADISLRNSVILTSYNGMLFYNTSNVRIEHCVFFRNLITSIILGDRSGSNNSISHNIFTDNLPVKAGVKIIQASPSSWKGIRDNCFYLRVPAEKRKLIIAGGADKEGKTLPEFQDELGKLLSEGEMDGSLAANPGFVGMQQFPVPPAKEGQLPYAVDSFMNDINPKDKELKRLDFDSFFATNPEVTQRGIGLEPAAFADFKFNSEIVALP